MDYQEGQVIKYKQYNISTRLAVTIISTILEVKPDRLLVEDVYMPLDSGWLVGTDVLVMTDSIDSPEVFNSLTEAKQAYPELFV